mgnify:CR=1 FL=1
METIIRDGGRLCIPSNETEARECVRYFGLPVELQAAFVLGGWRRAANSEDELVGLFKEGQNLSPIAEVSLFWKLPPCKYCGEPATGDYCEAQGYRSTHKAESIPSQ